MNVQKLLIGGIVGGVAYFLLGWLLYGQLLHNFFVEHPGTATNVDKPMEQFTWWALVLGNILSGFLVAYIFLKAGVSSLASGLVTGIVIGLLMAASYDCIVLGTTNIMSKHGALADTLAFTIMTGIVGAIVGAINGMGSGKNVSAT